MDIVVDAVRILIAPLTRTRLFRRLGPMLLPPVEADEDVSGAWARIEAQWPGYRAYERDSGRAVRLFRLQPVRRDAQ